jgi:hypothetical protein
MGESVEPKNAYKAEKEVSDERFEKLDSPLTAPMGRLAPGTSQSKRGLKNSPHRQFSNFGDFF